MFAYGRNTNAEKLRHRFLRAPKGIRRGGEFGESMMQFATAPTIAHVFKLKQPQVWTGRPMTQVFGK